LTSKKLVISLANILKPLHSKAFGPEDFSDFFGPRRFDRWILVC